jgi:hypothetical protein
MKTMIDRQTPSSRLRRFLVIGIGFWLAMVGVASAQTYATGDDPLTVAPTGFGPGDTVTVSGDGFEPGSDVEVVLVDEGAGGAETVPDTVQADENGAAEATVTIPDSYSGEGRLALRGVATDGAQRILGDPAPSADGSLARTGSSVAPWVIGGVSAAMLGSLLAFAARQRRRTGPIG